MTIDLPVEDRVYEMAELYQLLQSGIGLVVLVPAALRRVRAGAPLPVALGVVEIVAIVLALGAAVTQLRSRSDDAPRRLDLLNMFMGAVLLLEWGFATAGGHKWFSPTLLAGVISLALTVLQPRVDARRRRRRRLVIDDDGLSIATTRLRSFRIAWSEVADLTVDERAVRFRCRDGGTRTLSLGRYRNREAIGTAVAEGAAAVGIPRSEP